MEWRICLYQINAWSLVLLIHSRFLLGFSHLSLLFVANVYWHFSNLKYWGWVNVFILVKHYPTWEYLFLVHINKTISKWFSVRSIKAEKGSLFTYGHFLLNGRFYWIESIMKFKQFCFFLHSHIDVPSSDCHSSCLNKV